MQELPPTRTPVTPQPAQASGAQAPGAPAPVAAPEFTGPLTNRQIRDLRARRTELSNQLQSAAGRRADLAVELAKSPPGAQAGLQQRIAVLDSRLLQLETDIATTGRQLTNASLAGVDGGPGGRDFDFPRNGGPSGGNVTAIAVVFTIFVLFPISLSLTRLLWRRASRPMHAPISRESDERMERVEQAVESIAIEVERISEGQRFVTQLMSKAHEVPALGFGQAAAQPIRVPNAETIMVGAKPSGAV